MNQHIRLREEYTHRFNFLSSRVRDKLSHFLEIRERSHKLITLKKEYQDKFYRQHSEEITLKIKKKTYLIIKLFSNLDRKNYQTPTI